MAKLLPVGFPVSTCTIHTLCIVQEESSEVDKQLYQSIMAEVQWFLLDLFFLGYVEDPSSGLSFKMPSELNWECYFEVIVLWFLGLVL